MKVPRGQCIAGQPVRAPEMGISKGRRGDAARQCRCEHAVADIYPDQVDANDPAVRCQDRVDFLFGASGGEKFQGLANGWADAMGMPQCGFDLLDNSVRSA